MSNLGIHIEKVRKIGEGTYATAYLVKDLNDENSKKVIKYMDTSKGLSDSVIREITNIQHFSHPNILSVKPLKKNDGSLSSVFINTSKKQVLLSLEYMRGSIEDFYKIQENTTGSTAVPAKSEDKGSSSSSVSDKKKIKSLKPNSETLREMIRQITNGLYEMHSKGFVHNDIKLGNILYTYDDAKNYTFKIADFGLSQFIGVPFPASLNKFYCTYFYKAPDNTSELFYETANRYHYNSDMFSLGCIMYWICLKKNKLPLYNLDIKDIRKPVIDIRKSYFKSKEGLLKKLYGEDGYDFMIRCLDPNSKTRMSSKIALKHPYLSVSPSGLLGGANLLYGYIESTLFKPEITQVDYLNKQYEFEFMEDIFKNYKDKSINIYQDISKISPKINANMLHIYNDWIFTVIRELKISSVETILQYLLCFPHCLGNFEISKNKIQLLSSSVLHLQHKIFSSFRDESISVETFIHLCANQYKEEQFQKMEQKILESYNFNLNIKPIIFFLNYWYLKSIYSRPDNLEKKPNIKVLITSIAIMITQLVAVSNTKMIDINISDLAKYCVQKAIVLQQYQDYSNMDLFRISSVKRDLFDENYTKFISYKTDYTSENLEQYNFIVEMLST